MPTPERVFDLFGADYVWGVSDCCTAPCDMMLAHSGIDPMASIRGRYHSAKSAARILAGYGGLRETAKMLCGSRLKSGVGAVTIGTVRLPEPTSLHFDCAFALLHAGRWWVKAESGLVTLPMEAMLDAWHS
jgi:hypothetical protein